MTGAVATCDLALAGAAPDWVHLFPPNEMTARDGRRFNLADPQAVIDAFEAGAVDLPVDYEHQAETNLKERSGPVPAAGWIKELKSNAAGLWGRVEWTDQARELIASRAYRYISPSFFYSKAGKVITRLKGAGLVHRPALHLEALAAEEDPAGGDGLLARLVAFLELPEGTTEEEVFAKLEELDGLARSMATAAVTLDAKLLGLRAAVASPDPARFVPIDAVADLMKARGEDRAAASGERVRAKVGEALAKGYITPAMKGWATALCASDESAFDTFIAKSVPAFAHLGKPVITGTPPGRETGAAQSETAAAICAQLGLAPGALKE